MHVTMIYQLLIIMVIILPLLPLSQIHANNTQVSAITATDKASIRRSRETSEDNKELGSSNLRSTRGKKKRRLLLELLDPAKQADSAS